MYSSNDGHSEPTAVKGGDAEYKSVMDRYKKQKDAGTIGKMFGKRFMITFFLIVKAFFRSTAGKERTENIYDETAVIRSS